MDSIPTDAHHINAASSHLATTSVVFLPK